MKPNLIANPEEYRRLYAARNNFLNFIGQEKLVDLIRNIIDSAKSFEFRSETARTYIAPVNPQFVIKCLDPEVFKEPDGELFTDAITRMIEEEICSLVNIEVSKYAKEFMETEKVKFLSEGDGEFITHNTFSILANKAENIIYLKLLTF